MTEHVEKEWAWTISYDSAAYGPFATRELALEDAQSTLNDDDRDEEEITIGYAVWPDPGKYTSIDMDTLLDRADEAAGDDGCWSDDDTLFELTNASDAETELEKLIQDWARKWVKPTHWSFEEVEKITMRREV